MDALGNLLKPYSTEEFLNQNWANKAVHIASDGENKFSHLFSWEKFSYLLNFHELKYPELRLVLDEKVLDESANTNLIKLCQEGATLIINGVHKLIPEIATFTAAIKYELGYGAQVNTYCSWPGKQGFSSHYDTHEAFILQVEGNKKWCVFADTNKYPLPEDKSASLTPPEGEPYLTCIMSPGDVLYIPRGHWHYAVALDQPSLHLTLGVHNKTGIDFLEWLVSELRKKEAWRQNLPLRLETDSIKSHLDSLIINLNQNLELTNIAEEYTNYLDSLGKPRERYSLPFQAGFNIFNLGVKTKFKSANFQRMKVLENSEYSSYKILTSQKEISLGGVPIYLIEKLFYGEVFTGHDLMNWLPDFDWEIDLVPLLNRLVLEGLLFVDTSIN